ncbi:MAG TPA: hypothetical protein VGF53_15755 [Pseudolabrys sp.]|jgi:hypothetical protein
MFWRAFVAVLILPILAFLVSPGSLLRSEPKFVLGETMPKDFDAQMIAVRAAANSAMNALQMAQSQREISTELR